MNHLLCEFPKDINTFAQDSKEMSSGLDLTVSGPKRGKERARLGPQSSPIPYS